MVPHALVGIASYMSCKQHTQQQQSMTRMVAQLSTAAAGFEVKAGIIADPIPCVAYCGMVYPKALARPLRLLHLE